MTILCANLATQGFLLNARALDGSRVRRYSSGQKKSWFEFPIPIWRR
jgi:hypothetical protein